MRNRRIFNAILLGDPASGKATQAMRLLRRYPFLYNLDMGREVRRPSVKALYDYKRTTATGKLTPTRVVRHIFRTVIRRVPKSRGILFNGTPKMIGEARLVAKLLKRHKRLNPLVLYLSIPMRETVRRVGRGRRYGQKRVKRDDDSLRALLNRAQYYRTQIARVVVFFRKRYVFKKVSGVGTRDEVFRKIVRFVEANIRKGSAR